MVFAANGATVVDGTVLAVQFRDPERADEGPAYRSWFERAGYAVHEAKFVNEGEGDLMLAGDVVLAGTGFRTTHAAHARAQEVFGRPVITLQLVDPRFYHLDTALCVLSGSDGTGPAKIAYLPEAFSPGSPGGAPPAVPRRGHRLGRRRRGARPQRGQRRVDRRAGGAGR